jgi:hypothetical protein
MANTHPKGRNVEKHWQTISVYSRHDLSHIVRCRKLNFSPDERLNLHICPDQVRLKPSMEDGYAWSVSESKEYLLDTSLSRGSVGRYDIIMEELGRSIEAVTPASLQKTEALHTVPAKVSNRLSV